MSQAQRNPAQWVTLPGCKKVLIVVHTEVYGQRIQDLLPLLEADLRIQVAFTVAPHAFNEGAARLVRRLGAPVMPWSQAVRTSFDLALAAGSQGIEQLRAPVVVMPHGARHLKLVRSVDGVPPGAGREISGLGPRHLTAGGRVVPAAIALAHREDQDELARHCPQALPVAEVVGDPCHDRISASLPSRDAYRAALGLRGAERLVLVTSTWGRKSVFARLDALLPRLIAELPRPKYRAAVLIHPNVWAWHGGWQVRAWLAACRRAGIAVLSPQTDWRPALIAADWIIGDYGSVTLYGTMTGAPVLLSRYPHEDANNEGGSAGSSLALTVPALSASHPLADQLAYAAEEYDAQEYAAVATRICSEPGRFNRNFRRLVYRILGLGQPACRPAVQRLPLPGSLTGAVA